MGQYGDKMMGMKVLGACERAGSKQVERRKLRVTDRMVARPVRWAMRYEYPHGTTLLSQGNVHTMASLWPLEHLVTSGTVA